METTATSFTLGEGDERKDDMSKLVEKSTGNVFADVGLPNAAQELLKAKLTLQVHRLLKERGVTQAEAAALLKTTQPQVSALMGLKPVSVSVGRLLEFLTILGQDVEVKLRPTLRKRVGHMTVQVAA